MADAAKEEVRAHLMTKRWHGPKDDRKVVTREIAREGQFACVEMTAATTRAVVAVDRFGEVTVDVWRNGVQVNSYTWGRELSPEEEADFADRPR